MWEISENLHRAELTVLERSEQVTEWVRLAGDRNKSASCADIPRGRGQPQGGINAAVRELGVERTQVRLVLRHIWLKSGDYMLDFLLQRR
jgi:hypothetical protein